MCVAIKYGDPGGHLRNLSLLDLQDGSFQEVIRDFITLCLFLFHVHDFSSEKRIMITPM